MTINLDLVNIDELKGLLPKSQSYERHLADFKYMKTKLWRDLLKSRYTQSFKKDEMQILVTACTIAKFVLDGIINVQSQEDTENVPQTGNDEP